MSGWNTDFKEGGVPVIKVAGGRDGMARATDPRNKRGELLARVAAHLPDEGSTREPGRDVLLLEDAAIRVAAMNGGAAQFASTSEERNRRRAALIAVQTGETVEPTKATPEPKPKPPSGLSPADEVAVEMEFQEWADQIDRDYPLDEEN